MYREEFEDFPAFLAAVMTAGVNGYHDTDPRLEFAAAATGSGETVPSDGGFLVPTDFAASKSEAGSADFGFSMVFSMKSSQGLMFQRYGASCAASWESLHS